MSDSHAIREDSGRGPDDRPLSPGDDRLPGQRYDSAIHVWGACERPAAAEERFTAVLDDGVSALHVGRGMTLEKVLAFEADTSGECNGLGQIDHAYDLCVFDGRGIARAIIRRAPGVPDRVTILDVDAGGPADD